MLRKVLVIFLVVASLVGLYILPACANFGDRISVSGTQFNAGSTRIWINGCNTPWNSWNDFGGSFDYNWWDNHFATLHTNGINASRVWISCNGDVGININSSGVVSGCTSAFWSNLDSLFQIAQNRQVYIKATLISFDHFSDYHTTYQSWRNMITNSSNIDSMVNNYVVPFVNRYKNNPWLFCIDLCNEPDWIYENANCGNISWSWIQTYFAKAAVAIHANSSIPVTVGISMAPKYCSSSKGTNYVSDSALASKVGGDSRAKLDFWTGHHYDWMDSIWGNPFYMSPSSYGMDGGKPCLIGENPSNGTAGHTTTQDYESGYVNGWQGAMGWTSNGVDSQGSLTQLGPATNAFRNNHYSLVFPGGGSTPTPTATTSPTATPTATATATATPTSSTAATPTATATSTATASAGAVTVDNFESYASDSALQSAWPRVANGNGLTLYRETTNKSQGTYGMRFVYANGTAGFSGATHAISQNWTGRAGISLWIKPDGSGRTIAIQFKESSGEYWEYTYTPSGTTGVTVTIPWANFAHPGWYSGGNGVKDLGSIVEFGLYENGNGAATLYFDDIKAY